MGLEEEFVLQCVNPRTDGLNYLCNRNLDWSKVLEIANMQLVTPLLYQKLGKNKKIPRKVLAKLRRSYNRQIAINILAFEELKNLLRALKKGRIDATIIKGFAIAENYETPFARHAADIDLLLKEQDLGNIESILYKLNWSAPLNYPYLKGVLRQNFYHLPEFRKGPTLLDLHVILSPNINGINANELWKHSKGAKIENVSFKTLMPEHQLLHSCIQICLDDGFHRCLKKLIDIGQLSKKQEIDWNFVVEESKQWGISFLAYACFNLTNKLFDAKIPEQVLGDLKKDSTAFQLMLAKRISEENFFCSEGRCVLWRNLLQFAQRKSIAGKLAVIRKQFFPTRIRIAMRYDLFNRNKALLYAHWIAHPFIMLGQAVKVLSER